jgi:hypothetical protein
MKRYIWLSFDLGVNGDYEGMYAWLDDHHAKECGDSFAYLTFESKRDIAQAVLKDLKKTVHTTRNSRIYLVYLNEQGKAKGKFILGSRKSAPWTGYGAVSEEESFDEPEGA